MSQIATKPTAASLVEPVAGVIRQYADQMERERKMPDELFNALSDAGLFRTYLPPDLGEGGLPLPEALQVTEEVARVDGSAGWTVALGFAIDLFTGILEPGVARQTLSGPRPFHAGRGGQPGRAVPVDGGYRISGQWSYVSGCANADWYCLDALIFDGEQPRMQPIGVPEDILFFVPAREARILDTWHVSGLKGSGSYDVALDDVFVPSELTGRGLLATIEWKREGPIQRFSVMLALAIGQAPPVCLGIARHAIDAFKTLAATKVHSASQRPLLERPAAQAAVGKAESLVQSARAYFYGALQSAWDTAVTGDQLTPDQHVHLRLACVTVAENCMEAVDLLFRVAGSTSIAESCELEQCWRDVHAAGQQVQVQEGNWETCGRVLMGLDPNTFLF